MAKVEQLYSLALLTLSLGLNQLPRDAAGWKIPPLNHHNRKVDGRDSSTCACGSMQSSQESSRMTGGVQVQPDQLQFMVILQANLQGVNKLCGAFFINEKYLLTAAHCVTIYGQSGPQSPSNVSAKMASPRSGSDGGQLNLDNIYVHPQYTYSPLTNDIAILSLQTPMSGTNPVCLPDHNDYIVGANAVMIGLNSNPGGANNGTLEVGSTRLLNPAGCAYDGFSFATLSNIICASNMESTLCIGDGGMPLMSMNYPQSTAIGIASYGSGTCIPGPAPSVYTRIYSYLSFITSVTKGAPPCLVS